MLKTILKLIGLFLNKQEVPQTRPQAQSASPAPAERRDEVIEEISDKGYVWQNRLWRRHVMAQMFSMLGRRHNLPLSEENYDYCLRRRGNNYAWKMVKNEMRAQALLWNDDKEQWAERNRWFNKGLIETMARELNNPMGMSIANALASASTPDQVYKALKALRSAEGHKSLAWMDAYKGAGAYFTMKNLILFHNCKVHLDNGQVLDTEASFNHLKEVNAQPSTTGNSLFAMMMKLISDNNFSWRR